MRIENEEASSNVEDRRGRSMGRAGGIGIGTVIIALVASYFFGVDPRTIIGVAEQAQHGRAEQQSQGGQPPQDDAASMFVRRVLGSTERVWQEQFRQMGGKYPAPVLVLYTGATQTACGTGQAAMGPFYCPGDQQVYIDLDFYRDLKERFQAPGEFAQAYVVAHEVGHHVQNLLGVAEKVQAMRGRVDEVEGNQLQVRMELQADCYAGVWAHHAHESRQILEQGDIESGLNAASQIGDDRMQKRARGYVVPEAFTHGSAEQRVRWFSIGIKNGDLRQCDTFSVSRL
jgi:uncharacterized protein